MTRPDEMTVLEIVEEINEIIRGFADHVGAGNSWSWAEMLRAFPDKVNRHVQLREELLRRPDYYE